MQYKSHLTSRFENSISQADELLKVHKYLQVIPAKSVIDHLLRASLTMVVSAIDTLIHELVINAVIFEIKECKSVFKVDGINVGIAAAFESNDLNRLRLIEASLRRQYSKQSFQSSRQIESVLATVGITKIWKTLSASLNQPPDDIKIRLDLMVRRRNQIVHEGDLDQLHNPHEIERIDVENSFDFSRKLATGIIEVFANMIDA